MQSRRICRRRSSKSRNESISAPDADAVLARMTKLSERGLSLSLKSRHLVMLATLSAIGLPEHVESAVKAALRDGLTPAEVKEAFY